MKSNNSGTASFPPARFFRWLSTVLFVSALAAMVTLLVSDAFNALTPTELHRCAGALAFMLIGLSYVALQISLRRPRSEKVKAILLGIACGVGQR